MHRARLPTAARACLVTAVVGAAVSGRAAAQFAKRPPTAHGAASLRRRLDRLINQYRRIHSITFTATRTLAAGHIPGPLKSPPITSFRETARFAAQGPRFFTSMFVRANGQVEFNFQHAWNGQWDQQTQGDGIDFCVRNYHQPAGTADPQPMPGVLLPLVFLKREHHTDGTMHSMRWSDVQTGFKKLQRRAQAARWLHSKGHRVAVFTPHHPVKKNNISPRERYTIVFRQHPDYLPKKIALRDPVLPSRMVRLMYTFRYKRFAATGGAVYLPVLVHENLRVTGGKGKHFTAQFVERIRHLRVNTPLPLKSFRIGRKGVQAVYHGRKVFWIRPGSTFHFKDIPLRLYHGQ